MSPYPFACLLATLTALPGAYADDAQRRRVIEQKVTLVQRVLEDSAVARRIAASGNDDARAQLARAWEQHRRALALAGEGRLAASEAAIDEAMACIGRARQLVPDRHQLDTELRARYEALRESAQSMLAAARRQAGSGSGEAAAALERTAQAVAGAERLAVEGRTEDASRRLLEAERTLLATLPVLLGTNTLDYAMRFASPAEELRYETERYGSLRGLVPVALHQLRPEPAAVEQVALHLRSAEQRDREAEAHAARGEIAAALEARREATDWLQRALAAAGLRIPGP